MIESTRTNRAPAIRPARAAGARGTLLALSRLTRTGTIVVAESGRETIFGTGAPMVHVTMHDARAYQLILRSGSVGLGESYVAGWWDCDDLTTLLRILLRSLSPLTRLLDRNALSRRPVTSLVPNRRRANDREHDRRNVRAHYDLSNDFFELMLDETMSYSCAMFDSPGATLAEASRAKMDRMCHLLQLEAGDHVLEIGTGWGGFALHAASHYGCRITTTTISHAQFDHASARVADAGLSERVTVLNRDYRDLSGHYDKVVSIEMIEAIGWRQIDTYFARCASLLKPGGLLAIQAIVIDNASFARAKHHKDFINQMVFPGGCLPSIGAMVDAASDNRDLRLVHLDDIGDYYPETLARWRENLIANADEVAALSLGRDIERLWSMYLAYCEAGFIEHRVSAVQMVFAKRA